MSKKLLLWKKEDYPVVEYITSGEVVIYFYATRSLAVEYNGQFFIFHAFDALEDNTPKVWEYREFKNDICCAWATKQRMSIVAIFNMAISHYICSFGLDPGEWEMILAGRELKRRRRNGKS